MLEVEFLRQLSDLINNQLRDTEQDQDDQPQEIGDSGEGNDAENPMDRDDTFVPPLQAKIEIMKKLAGIPPKDETLKQSQRQGGPAGGSTPNPAANSVIVMHDMADDSSSEY